MFIYRAGQDIEVHELVREDDGQTHHHDVSPALPSGALPTTARDADHV